MPEKPPKGPFKNNEPVYFDFAAKKRRPGPPENPQPKPPEITMDEAKMIFQDIFDNFEPKVWHLHGLVKKAREKFDAYEHLVSSSQYSEGHYRTFVNQKRPHRMGGKVVKEREIPQIFSEDEKQLYGKIHEYEKEFKDYLGNFLTDREGLEHELHTAHSHLKNVGGAEELKEKLEKYLEKVDFDFTSFAFMGVDPEGYRKKIETMEAFAKKLVN